MASQILVTDATSFVSSHIIKQLQAEGHQVRGTVSSLQDEEERVKKLQEELNGEEAKYKIEVVEADPAKADCWDAAMKDVKFVIHSVKGAAAVPSTTEGEAPSQPATDAVLNVFKACVAAKSVTRVILTSSYQAIAAVPTVATDKVYTEADWADAETTVDVLTKSVILAEKAAWDFVKELTDADKVELTVINPTNPVGPAILDVQQDVVKMLMEKGINGCPRVNYSLVDVRDVAAAHVKALTLDEVAGNRLIVHGANVWMREIAQALAKEFKPQGYGVPTVALPGFALWGLSLFNKNAKTFLPLVGKQSQFDNTKLKETAGIEAKDVKESVVEEAQVLIDRGLVKKTKKVKNNGAAAADGAAVEGGEAAKVEEEGGEKKEEGGAGDEKPAENGEVKEEAGEKKEEEEKKEEAATDTAPAEEKPAEKKEEEEKKEEVVEAKSEEKPAEESAPAAPAAEESKAE